MSEEVRAGYKLTEVGVFPSDWECQKLEEYFSFITYGFTNPMPTVEHGVYMVTAADIYEGRIQLESARKTTEIAYRTLLTAKSKPKNNDILLTKDGSLGRLALVGNETICINQSVAVIRPNERVEPNFLKLLLESPHYQKRMLEDAGGSTIKHIYITIVNLMPVALPANRAEQRAIAAALSDVDALLEGLTRLIAKKRDLKQAAMQQLLTGQTRLPGFIGEWEMKRLGDVAEIVSGGTPKTGLPAYWDGDIKWCTPTDITGTAGKYLSETARTISTLGLASCSARLLPAGALLLCSRATIGEIKIATSAICTNQGFKSIICNRDVSNEFLYYKLHTMKPQMVERAIGSTFLEISKKDTVALEVELPDLDEQTAIATVLSDMDAELAALEARRDKTRALKQAMMRELLTGKTRLVSPEVAHA